MANTHRLRYPKQPVACGREFGVRQRVTRLWIGALFGHCDVKRSQQQPTHNYTMRTLRNERTFGWYRPKNSRYTQSLAGSQKFHSQAPLFDVGCVSYALSARAACVLRNNRARSCCLSCLAVCGEGAADLVTKRFLI